MRRTHVVYHLPPLLHSCPKASYVIRMYRNTTRGIILISYMLSSYHLLKFVFIEQIISHKYEFFHPNKKGGVYSTPTSMSVPFLNRNVILLSLCTVAVSKSVSHNPSSQVSRTRGCFSIVPMKMRSSRSRFTKEVFLVEQCTGVEPFLVQIHPPLTFSCNTAP